MGRCPSMNAENQPLPRVTARKRWGINYPNMADLVYDMTHYGQTHARDSSPAGSIDGRCGREHSEGAAAARLFVGDRRTARGDHTQDTLSSGARRSGGIPGDLRARVASAKTRERPWSDRIRRCTGTKAAGR